MSDRSPGTRCRSRASSMWSTSAARRKMTLNTGSLSRQIHVIGTCACFGHFAISLTRGGSFVSDQVKKVVDFDDVGQKDADFKRPPCTKTVLTKAAVFVGVARARARYEMGAQCLTSMAGTTRPAGRPQASSVRPIPP